MGDLEYAGLTDRGRMRKENQDDWFADPEQGLFIVADGMGGHLGGSTASRIVVQTLPMLLEKRLKNIESLTDTGAARTVAETIAELSRKVREEGSARAGLYGMGATVVLAQADDTHVMVAHMGDSRAYLMRAGEFRRLTKDHSIVQILIDCGEITEAEAGDHPARGRITKGVGLEGDMFPDINLLEFRRGDLLLLCCDGLTDMLKDGEIAALLKNAPDLETLCRRLVHEANHAGGRDNITVIAVKRSDKQ